MQDTTTQSKDIILSRGAYSFGNIPLLFIPSDTPEKKKRPKKPPTDERVPQMVTVNQLAELTGLSAYSIRKLCKQNEIHYYKAGKKVLINYNKFLEYLNNI